jgi:hypothetical protein
MERLGKERPWSGCRHSAPEGGSVSSVKLAVTLTLGVLVVGGLIGFVVRSRVATPTPDYLGTGTVVSLLPPPSALHATRPVIIIHHEPIPGLMEEAMSMPFIAASSRLFEGLRPGDRIAFGLKSTPEALLVVSLERLGAGGGK